MYDFQDLLAVQIKGEALEGFLNTWDMVLMSIRHEQPEDVLRVLFLKNIRKVGYLKDDLIYYDRLPDNDPNRTYDYLMQMVRRTLSRRRQEINRQQHSRSLAGEGQGQPSAPGIPKETPKQTPKLPIPTVADSTPAPGKGKGKGGGKGGGGTPKTPGGGTPKNAGVCYQWLEGNCTKGVQVCPFKEWWYSKGCRQGSRQGRRQPEEVHGRQAVFFLSGWE